MWPPWASASNKPEDKEAEEISQYFKSFEMSSICFLECWQLVWTGDIKYTEDYNFLKNEEIEKLVTIPYNNN